jgi:hypothetical protein
MSTNTILATTPLVSTNYLLRATGTTIGNSLIFDNGTNVGIGNTNTSYTLDVSGTGRYNGSATTMLSVVSSATASGLELKNTGGTASNWIIQSDGGAVAGQAALRFYSITASAYRMSIDGSGNVGIGTSSPTAKVHAVNSGNGFIYRFAGGTSSEITGGIFASTASGFASIGTTSNHPFNIFTNDTDRLTITGDGRTIVTNTNSSFGILRVNNTSGGESSMAFFAGSDATSAYWTIGKSVNGDTGNFGFYYNGNKASISNSTGAYTPLSDINKKKDFEISEIGLDAIMGLKPTLYRMKSDGTEGNKELGFIAQEVKEFIPQAYVESGEEENNKFIGLNYNAIVAALTKGMQEQNQIINDLKERIVNLESK